MLGRQEAGLSVLFVTVPKDVKSEDGKWVSTFSYLMLAIKGLNWKVLIIGLVEVVDRTVT